MWITSFFYLFFVKRELLQSFFVSNTIYSLRNKWANTLRLVVCFIYTSYIETSLSLVVSSISYWPWQGQVREKWSSRVVRYKDVLKRSVTTAVKVSGHRWPIVDWIYQCYWSRAINEDQNIKAVVMLRIHEYQIADDMVHLRRTFTFVLLAF